MNKIQIDYGPYGDSEQMVMEVRVYTTEKSKDGTHISASCLFNAYMLKRLSQTKIDALIANLIPAIEECNAEVERRMQAEGMIKYVQEWV